MGAQWSLSRAGGYFGLEAGGEPAWEGCATFKSQLQDDQTHHRAAGR